MVDYRGLPWWNSRYGVGETKVRESLVYSTGETCNLHGEDIRSSVRFVGFQQPCILHEPKSEPSRTSPRLLLAALCLVVCLRGGG